jgi:hypothetical protein
MRPPRREHSNEQQETRNKNPNLGREDRTRYVEGAQASMSMRTA